MDFQDSVLLKPSGISDLRGLAFVLLALYYLSRHGKKTAHTILGNFLAEESADFFRAGPVTIHIFIMDCDIIFGDNASAKTFTAQCNYLHIRSCGFLEAGAGKSAGSDAAAIGV